jgi:hypothetical protein
MSLHPRETSVQEVLPGVHLIPRLEPSGWCLNTILVATEGGLIVYSPTRNLGDSVHAQIAELGAPRWLVAPNHFHHLGITEWRTRYPQTMVLAGSGALPRLAKKYPALELRAIGTVEAIDSLEPEGTKNGEVWVRAHGAWLVGDAFLNVAGPVSGVTGFVLKLTGTAPGFCISRLWGALHLADRAKYRSWLFAELDRAPPTWLVPSHGEPISSPELARQLRELASKS